MKYILVSGGVISGIGKGVIGMPGVFELFIVKWRSSLLDGAPLEDHWIEGYSNQD
jgi:hypothetical protein